MLETLDDHMKFVGPLKTAEDIFIKIAFIHFDDER